MVRTMNIDDYDEVSRLWHKIKGFSIRSIDDSRAVSYTHLDVYKRQLLISPGCDDL